MWWVTAYADTMTIPVRVRIDKVVAGGDGLARMDDGRVVFVPAVLPGELVAVELVDTKSDFARAVLLAVDEPSPKRRVPPCEHVAEGCGGCDWQHVEHRVQGQLKLAIVEESYARTARLEVSPQLRRLGEGALRTTVRMAASVDGSIGFRRADSHEVVPVRGCGVAHEMINAMISQPILDGPGEVTIRVGARTGDRGILCHEGRLAGQLPEGVRTGHSARVSEVIAGRTMQVSMESFFQPSPEAAELLLDSVSRRLDGLGVRGGRMVDAYGGVGLFSVGLAERFDELVVVESSESACRDAVRNLADTAGVIECCEMEMWDACRAEVVVADPARRGLGKQGAAAVVATDAPTVVLVSCDPVAGARDARLLVDAGYTIGEVEVLDIFPETHHVEVVAAFSR